MSATRKRQPPTTPFDSLAAVDSIQLRLSEMSTIVRYLSDAGSDLYEDPTIPPQHFLGAMSVLTDHFAEDLKVLVRDVGALYEHFTAKGA